MDKLEAVRAKVIEAVPEIRRRVFADTTIEKSVDREITLADVLRAMMDAPSISPGRAVDTIGYFVVAQWNHEKTSLDEQEPEVIEFLHKILIN